MTEEIRKNYECWCEKATGDQDLVEELKSIAGDEAKIEDAFYRNLAFGTGGLRGVIGAGTNRVNIYTIAKASQGLADYVNKNFPEEARSIAISYDSRIKSDVFAKVAAGVFAANGINAHIYTELMPTPCLSYAVRALKCAAGIMVTASHNPSKYNGYKVYGPDGCQITTEAAEIITAEIEKLDIFADVKMGEFNDYLDKADGVSIKYIPDQVYTDFVEEVKKQSMLGEGDEIDRNVAIIYTPLNGTGLKPVTRTLKETGFTNITVVKEQEKPDGHFPTCPYPNPEIREAMQLGMDYAAKNNADLLLATDPDADRVGIAVKDKNGEYVLLTGNQTGCLLLDYVCSMRVKNGKMPEKPVVVKTIVSTDMADRIAESYGCEVRNVLTGFKFIGEQIGLLEKDGEENRYVIGFEESYGYLAGTYVRDKDAVVASFLICEMFAYYKTKGVSLLEKLDELYAKYGYTLNTLYSFEFEGSAGFEKMKDIMASFRSGVSSVAGRGVKKLNDYAAGIDGLPKSDVLKFFLDGDCSVVVRPSGTEPKLKLYVSVSAEDKDKAKAEEEKISGEFKEKMK